MRLVRCLTLMAAFTIAAHGQGSQLTPSSSAISGGGSNDKLDRILEILNESSRPSESSSLSSTITSYLLEELRITHTRLQRIETTMQMRNQDISILRDGFDSQLQNFMSSLRNETETQLRARSLGSTYIRWGRKSCPRHTTLVYTGIAGGKLYNQPGSGSNRLCLTNEPQFDNTTRPSLAQAALLYGGEYQIAGNHLNHDVPCSVCLTPQASTIMIPATLTCPPGWTPQYTGQLAAERHDYSSADYVCLDGEPEYYDSGVRYDAGLFFYLVLTRCGSLPCPPYFSDRVVTCVVCSR